MTDEAKNITPEEFSEFMADLIGGVDVGIVATEMVRCLAGCYNLCILNGAPDAMNNMRAMLQALLDAMNANAPLDDDDDGPGAAMPSRPVIH